MSNALHRFKFGLKPGLGPVFLLLALLCAVQGTVWGACTVVPSPFGVWGLECGGGGSGSGDEVEGASNLTTVGAVVIVGATGEVTQDAQFTYNPTTDILTPGRASKATHATNPYFHLAKTASTARDWYWQYNTNRVEFLGGVASTSKLVLTDSGSVCIGPDNTGCTGTLHIQDTTATTGDTLHTVKGGAGESGNLTEWRSNANTLLAAMSMNGDLTARVIQLTSGTEGTCDSSRRGAEVHTFGGAGVADTVRKCVKDGSDSYLWVSII